MKQTNISRRQFLGTAAVASTALIGAPYIKSAKAASDEVNIWTYTEWR